MVAVANVTLTDTFDQWRIKTNQLISVYDQTNELAFRAYNVSNSVANSAANIAVELVYGNTTIMNRIYENGNTITYAWIGNNDITTIKNRSNIAVNTANFVYQLANGVSNTSNFVYGISNSVYNVSNIVYSSSNGVSNVSNLVYSFGNIVFGASNTVSNSINAVYNTVNNYTNTVNSIYVISNNTVNSFNSLMVTVNTYSNTINTIYDRQNTVTNTVNSIFATTNNYTNTVNSIYVTTNNYTNTVNSIYVFSNNTVNTVNVIYVKANDSSNVANVAYLYSNNAYNIANNVQLNVSNIVANTLAANTQIVQMINATANIVVFNYLSTTDFSAAYVRANLAYQSSNNTANVGNIIFNKANSAYDISINASPYVYVNSYANSVGVSANSYANTLYVSSLQNANTDANSANAFAVTIGAASNTWANTKVASVTGTAGQIFSSGGTTPTLNLITTSVSSSTYGGSTQIPVVSVDTFGRLTYAANVAVQGMDYAYANGVANAANSNAATKVASVTGTSGQIFSSGGTTPTLNLITTAVTSSTYGGATQIPVFTVDTFGRLTYAANVVVQGMDYPFANGVANSANIYGMTYGNSSFGTIANTASAFRHANAAFDKANTGGTFTGNVTFSGHTISFTSNIASQVLTDGPSINWNLSSGSVAFVTLGGNRTLENPSNMRVGSYIIHVIQDVSGNRTLAFGSAYKWPAGVAPVLSTTGNARDIFSFVCDGINMYGSFLPDVK